MPGAVRLEPAKATLKGRQIKMQVNEDRDNIGYWDNPTDRIHWLVWLDRPGQWQMRGEFSCAGQGYWSARFDLSPETLRLIQQGYVRCTVDQQPYIQGFYPVIQLTLYLRYGIMPSDIDAGAAIIDKTNVNQVIELTRENYR